MEDYEKGSWFGNSSLAADEIFQKAVLSPKGLPQIRLVSSCNILIEGVLYSDLLNITLVLQSGQKLKYDKEKMMFSILSEYFWPSWGKCFD